MREWAMTMMLVARALERIGDNAVDIGEQVAFVVTGLFREFEDASHHGERPRRRPPTSTPAPVRDPGSVSALAANIRDRALRGDRHRLEHDEAARR